MHFNNSQHRSRTRIAVVILLLVSNLYQFAESNDVFQPQLEAPSDGVQFYRKLQQAQQLYEKEKWAEAEPIYKELVAEYSLNGTIWGQLAKILRLQGKYADALNAYERVINLQGPGLPFSGRYWIAVCHAKLGHTDAALNTLQQMVFQEAELMRPELLTDSNFASLKDNPRFQEIAGKKDISKVERVEGWRGDIDYLAAELKRNNPANMPIPEEFFKRQRELKEQVPNLNDWEIIAGMGRMLNSLNRGHTALWLGVPGSKLDFRPMPVRFYIFPEGIFVTEGFQGNEDLAGAQVLKFGNTSAAEAFQRARAARSAETRGEIAHVSEFDYVIMNDDFSRALLDLQKHRQGRTIAHCPPASTPERSGKPTQGLTMARITVDDCLKQIPNRFEMSLAATYRARQITNGAQPMLEANRDKPTVIALRELAASKYGPEILNKAQP